MSSKKEGARKTVEAEVRSISPDWCWTPRGATMVLVPYNITAKLTLSEDTVKNVHFTGEDTFTMKSWVPHVVGDEDGTGGGVYSGVNQGSCHPVTNSETVKAGGAYVIRHTSLFHMNCNKAGTANTLGKLSYVKTEGGTATEPDLGEDDVKKAMAKYLKTSFGSWWDKVTPDFKAKVEAIATGLGTTPNDLMAVMALETGSRFTSNVRNGGRVGLVQLGPTEAGLLGTTTAQLARMTPTQQLGYVDSYLRMQPGIKALLKAGSPVTAQDISLAIFHPAPVPKDGVLYTKGKDGYKGNEGLDTNHDGKITVKERMGPVQKLLDAEEAAEKKAAEAKAGIRVSGPKPGGDGLRRQEAVQGKLLTPRPATGGKWKD